MNFFTHLRIKHWLVLHFQAKLNERQETKLRRHLNQCNDCRILYHALLAAEGQGVAAAKVRRERLMPSRLRAENYLSPDGTKESRPWLDWRLAGALCGSAALVILLLLPDFLDEPHQKAEFHAKGIGNNSLNQYIRIYPIRRNAQNQLEPAGSHLQKTEALLFLYSNQDPKAYTHLLLFGIDDTYHVYWFYPAWTDPKENPSAYPIQPGKNIQLPEEVSHDYHGSRLRLFALFLRGNPISVKAIEAQVLKIKAQGQAIETLTKFPISNTGQHTLLFSLDKST